jgi:hypothetical protein
MQWRIPNENAPEQRAIDNAGSEKHPGESG